MSDRLVIRLMADQESVEWGLLNQQENTPTFVERGNLLLADLVSLAEYAANKTVLVLIPAAQVRTFMVDAPTKNRSHLEKAVPFLLEEQIIENVETQHFAIGQVGTDSKLAVNVIAKKYLEELLVMLDEAAIEPDFLLADATCLPVFDDAWSLLDSQPVLVRQDRDTFWSADADMVADLLQWNLQEKIEETQAISQAVRVFSAEETPISLDGIAGLAVQQMPVDDELLWLASQDTKFSINLLQQKYTSSKKSSQGLGDWKLPLIAASVLLLVGLSYVFSNIFILNSELNDYRQQALTEVRKISPSLTMDKLDSKMMEIDGSSGNVAANVGEGGGVLLLLDKIYQEIDPQQIKLEQMDYVAKQGQLSMDMSSKNYQLLQSAQQAIEKKGMKTDLKNARENNGGWTARLIVKVK